jgi:hypothetical protein
MEDGAFSLEVDMLLAKLRAGTISFEECWRLERWLVKWYQMPSALPSRPLILLVLGAIQAFLEQPTAYRSWWRWLWPW